MWSGFKMAAHTQMQRLSAPANIVLQENAMTIKVFCSSFVLFYKVYSNSTF